MDRGATFDVVTGMEPAVMVFAHLEGGVNRWHLRTEGHREVDFGPGFTPTDEAVRWPIIPARDACGRVP